MIDMKEFDRVSAKGIALGMTINRSSEVVECWCLTIPQFTGPLASK